jgi:hypothetical protein
VRQSVNEVLQLLHGALQRVHVLDELREYPILQPIQWDAFRHVAQFDIEIEHFEQVPIVLVER